MTKSASNRVSRPELQRRQSLISGIDLDETGLAELRRLATGTTFQSTAPHAVNELDRLGLIRRNHVGFILTPRGRAVLDDWDATHRKPARRR